jgi:hypothetical protein
VNVLAFPRRLRVEHGVGAADGVDPGRVDSCMPAAAGESAEMKSRS